MIILALISPLPSSGEDSEPWHPAKAGPVDSGVPDQWHVRNPLAFFGVSFGKDIFVAVGATALS